jgi:hypothetical protein
MITRRQLIAGAAGVPAALALNALQAPSAEAFPYIIMDRTQRTYGPVMHLGDSTSAGYVSHLRRTVKARGLGPVRCDIQSARSLVRYSKNWPSTLWGIRYARKQGFDPSSFLLAVGHNDLYFVRRDKDAARRMIDRVLTEIGPDHTVGFLTLFCAHKSSAPKFNAALEEATHRWPNLHVFDWASIAQKHLKWHGWDGVHYTMHGARMRNYYLADSMVELTRIHDATTATTTTTSTTTSTTSTTTTTLSPG